MSPDTYNCRLNTFNIVVALINVLLPAIDWVLVSYEFEKAGLYVIQSQNGCLVLSCVILVLGFKKLASVMQSDKNLVNKGMIIWHIIAYFFNVTAIFVEGFFLANPKQYEITTCCILVTNLACTVILALIVNEICTKALQEKSSDLSALCYF